MIFKHDLNEHMPTTSLLDIPEKVLARYKRLYRPADIQNIAEMYWLKPHQVSNALDRGRADQATLDALVNYYG